MIFIFLTDILTPDELEEFCPSDKAGSQPVTSPCVQSPLQSVTTQQASVHLSSVDSSPAEVPNSDEPPLPQSSTSSSLQSKTQETNQASPLRGVEPSQSCSQASFPSSGDNSESSPASEDKRFPADPGTSSTEEVQATQMSQSLNRKDSSTTAEPAGDKQHDTTQVVIEALRRSQHQKAASLLEVLEKAQDQKQQAQTLKSVIAGKILYSLYRVSS